jgi:hypothetical protein
MRARSAEAGGYLPNSSSQNSSIGVRARTGLEQADLQRFTFKQCFTADFQGIDPGILTQVQAADYCYSEAQKRCGRDAKKKLE